MNLLTSDNLTTGDIKDLIEQPQRVCVSMFIPTERKGWQTQQNPVRLKNMLQEGTRYSVTQLDLPEDIPQSLAKALQYDVFEKESQAHAVRSGSTGARQRAVVGGQGTAVFFGQGAAKDAKKDEILEYFQKID